MAGQNIVISVLADTKQFSSAMKGLDSSLGGLGSKLAGVGKGIGLAMGAAAVGVGALVVQGISQAGQLEQSIGAIDTVFKGSAKQMSEWASGAAQSVGLTKNEYNELGTLIGTQLKNGGTAMDQLAPKTDNLIRLGADLSSMFGGSSKEAVEALSSALKGERDPIEKYGVSLNQAKIDAEAAALGFKKVGGSLSDEANQAATLSLIMKQTSDAHGNFAKESDTLAGKQQRLSAEFTNFTTNIGMALLPMITELVGVLADNAQPIFETITNFVQTQLVPAFKGFGEWMQSTGIPSIQGFFGFMNDNKDVIGIIAVALGTLVGVFAIAQGALAAYTAVVEIAKAVQLAWNLSLFANPIGLIILAVAALAAGLIYFFTQTEVGKKAWADFTKFLGSTWDTIVQFFSKGIDGITKWLTAAWKAIEKGWNDTMTFLGQIPSKVKAVFDGALQWLVSAGKGIMDGLKNGIETAWTAVTTFFSSIPSKITSALGSVGSILSAAGQSIIDGFLSGLRSSWKGVTDFVGGIADWIRANKGPLPYDRALLKPAGQAIMGGFLSSLQDGYAEVQSFIGGIGSDISNGINGNIDSMSPPANGNLYVINGLALQGNGRLEEAFNVLAQEIEHYAGVGV